MDYGAIVSDAIDYTRDALVGNWMTLLFFVLFSLPFALMQFVYDPKKVFTGTTFHWELINWPALIGLLLIGVILSLFLSGYSVRIYRGITPPPVFDAWVSLFIDGIKLVIVGILWFLPAMVVLFAAIICLVIGGFGGMGVMLAVGVLLGIIALVLFIIVILYGILGSVRFARMGSIREGIRFSALTETIRNIGWGSYILSLLVLVVLAIVFCIVIAVLSIIPYIGWVLELIVNPFLTVFMARYISRVYDHGVPQPPQTPAPAPAITP